MLVRASVDRRSARGYRYAGVLSRGACPPEGGVLAAARPAAVGCILLELNVQDLEDRSRRPTQQAWRRLRQLLSFPRGLLCARVGCSVPKGPLPRSKLLLLNRGCERFARAPSMACAQSALP